MNQQTMHDIYGLVRALREKPSQRAGRSEGSRRGRKYGRADG